MLYILPVYKRFSTSYQCYEIPRQLLPKSSGTVPMMSIHHFLIQLPFFFFPKLSKMFFCFPDPHFKRSNERRRIIGYARELLFSVCPVAVREGCYVVSVGPLFYHYMLMCLLRMELFIPVMYQSLTHSSLIVFENVVFIKMVSVCHFPAFFSIRC